MDFVHYQLATGRKLRILTIVDTFSRFSPALEPRFTFRGADVVEVLERVGRQVGFPTTIRVDQRVRVAQFHRGKPDRRILELLSLDRED